VLRAAAHGRVRRNLSAMTSLWIGTASACEWFDEGVDVRIGYVSETATNAQGGDRELVRYTDQITFSAMLDLEKLLGLPQATFKLAITDRNGDNLSNDANLQSLQQVQELYGRDQTWRWTQFWYQQKYLDGLVTWKIGRITDGEDFAAFSCEFMNLTFCGAPAGNIVGSYWYNWPVSQWATDVKDFAQRRRLRSDRRLRCQFGLPAKQVLDGSVETG
jgi:porin